MMKTKRETKKERVERLFDEAVAQAEELKPVQRIEVWKRLAHRSVGRLTTEAVEGLE